MSSAGICCAACAQPETESDCVHLTQGALEAMRYILTSEAKKVFSFTLGDAALANLGCACEKYAAAQLDYHSKALEYYKRVSGI